MNAPDLADVLAEVNRLRAERGMDPLDAMPKGVRRNSLACPLRNALDVFSIGKRANGTYSVWFSQGGDDMNAPPVLDAFAQAFDDGKYPELVA